jgi:MFS family permease
MRQRAKRRILVAASLVCSLTLLDSNIVAVSLPSIARTLGAGFADIEWVISAYVLSFAALLLAAGSYADLHGRKRTTLIGLVVFAVASGLCGLAQSVLMLDLARALQGVGGSMVLTAALGSRSSIMRSPSRSGQKPMRSGAPTSALRSPVARSSAASSRVSLVGVGPSSSTCRSASLCSSRSRPSWMNRAITKPSVWTMPES